MSERIFTYLQEKGISQKELSDLTGIPTLEELPLEEPILEEQALEELPLEIPTLEAERCRHSDYVFAEKGRDEYISLTEYHVQKDRQGKRLLGYLNAVRDVGDEEYKAEE